MHTRVKVMKTGPDLNKVGSVTALYPTEADVILDDGSDQHQGGELPPAKAKRFLLTEIAEA
jgi:hypothetical protein